ncbi:MAG: hypothetical protein QXU32_11385 [Nitrososphaerales archaeon]
MVSPKEDRSRYELHAHFGRMGIESTVIDPGILDFDHDYPYLDLDDPVSGATSLGSVRLHGYPINIVNIVREKNYEVGHLGFGGDYGPIEFASNGWRLRFFITHYDEWEVPLPPDLTQFSIGTRTKIEKGLLSTRVTDFEWQTLNNGLTRIEDEILKRLNSDTSLHSLILNELSKERNVTLRSYKPKKTPKQAAAEPSYARIMIYGDARKRKDMFISRNCFDMYNKIAEHILQATSAL